MSPNYDDLERLQRLRESGALSDEEFQAEKRRILGCDAVEPAAAEPAGPAPEGEGPPSRRPLYWLLGGGALAVAVAAGLWLGNLVGGGETYEEGNAALPQDNVAAAGNLIEAEPLPDPRTLPADEQLARASEAAFGARGPATVTMDFGKDYGGGEFMETVRYAPGKLIWPAFGPVLLSQGEVQGAAHVSAGKVAIHYLKPAGDRFEVVRAFPSGVVAGDYGKLKRWSVSPRFSNWPVVVTEGDAMAQGYRCGQLILTELRPEGPVQLVSVPIAYEDSGAKGQALANDIRGKVLNVVKNQSFDVVYSGTRAFSEHYVRTARGYEVAGGKSNMMVC